MITGYANDNMSYCLAKIIKKVVDNLETLSEALLTWLRNKNMTATPDK